MHGNNEWFSNAESAVHQVESNPPIQQNGNTIRIGYNLPEDVRRHVSITYEVTVPAELSVQAHSGSGSVGRRGGSRRSAGPNRLRRHPTARPRRPLACADRQRQHPGAGRRRPFLRAIPAAAISKPNSPAPVMWMCKPVLAVSICAASRADCARAPAAATSPPTAAWPVPGNCTRGSGTIRLALGSGNGFNLDVHTSSGSIHSDLADYRAGLDGPSRTEGDGARRRS